jgi:hypothetical protein
MWYYRVREPEQMAVVPKWMTEPRQQNQIQEEGNATDEGDVQNREVGELSPVEDFGSQEERSQAREVSTSADAENAGNMTQGEVRRRRRIFLNWIRRRRPGGSNSENDSNLGNRSN